MQGIGAARGERIRVASATRDEALGSFTENGGLWLQGQAEAVDVKTKWRQFDPLTYHRTIPWGPEGSDRWVFLLHFLQLLFIFTADA